MAATTIEKDAKATPARATSSKKKMSWPRRILDVLVTLLLVGMLALLGALVIVPKATGSYPLVILTGSMTPTYMPGDVVIAKPTPISDIRIGDVVTFMPNPDDPMLITHRVIERSVGTGEPKLTTQGDANGAPDDPILEKQILGKVIYHVPKAGWLLQGLSGTRTTLAYLAAALLIGYGLITVLRKDKDEKPAGKGTKDNETGSKPRRALDGENQQEDPS